MIGRSKKADKSNIANNQVKIRLWQRFGSDVKHLRSEYIGTETKDDYGNPVVINEVRGHNQDFGFSQHEVYASLRIAYSLAKKNRVETLLKIDKDMSKTRKRIELLEQYPELNAVANVWNERQKLERLRIFRKYAEYKSDNGSYYVEENGMRCYDFESIDGFFVPIWHDADTLVDFSDCTYNRKTVMQETVEVKRYLDEKKKENLKYASLFMVMIITAVLCGVFVFGIYKTLGYHQESVARWEEPAHYCAEQSAKIFGTVTNILDNEVVRGCLLANNQTELIEEVNTKIKELKPDK